MNHSRHEWDAAADAWLAAERDRLGEPPTPEEVAAYTSGTLAGEDAARVRALLAYYPELTAETEPEPADDVLTEFDVARDRAALRARLAAEKPSAWRHLLPVAAAITIAVLSALLLQSRSRIAELSRDGERPYVLEERHQLQALHARGPATPPPYELPAGEEHHLLALALPQSIESRDLRIELVSVSGRKENIVWTSTTATPDNGTLELSLPARFLQKGTYRIDVRSEEELVDSFWIRAGGN